MHLVIIGNGIAGISCALTARRLRPDARISIVSSESRYHYSRPALMYLYLGQLRPADVQPYAEWFWRENRLELVFDTATRLDTAARLVQLAAGPALPYDQLLLATGSRSRFFAWPGQQLAGVQGFYGLPDLARMEQNTRGIERAVVVGGGLIGVELAEMLRSRGVAVTLLVRDAHYWASVLPAPEARLIDQQLGRHGVEVRYGTELAEILGDGQGRVRAVRSGAGEEIPCQWVGLATGVQPNLALVADSAVETDQGILVDELLQTSVPGVYAAGDCAQLRRPGFGEAAVEQLWYTGRMQGETVAHSLCGQPTPYRRGPWFNSAKFFDLEYQTYGRVPAHPAPDLASFYWQHPRREQALRLSFEAAAPHALRGLHSLGLRLRQAVCEQWLREAVPVAQVVAQLAAADFSPEFSPLPAADVGRAFAAQFPQFILPSPARHTGLLARWLGR
ncbi:NAD(P)/FAD-dependent oxidoreductase [Hymenobacter sp. B81]|uniref:NAD(P)/FAD-dependent oxidoreductase n=1 Tax=Hymenobacter sp. B81 TaxID=3344878 RepID=UPI0037DD23F3